LVNHSEECGLTLNCGLLYPSASISNYLLDATLEPQYLITN
jgi:hypothetical protein